MAEERLGWKMEDPNKLVPNTLPPLEGTFKSDGSEKRLVESRGSKLEGYIDLSSMGEGDKVAVSEYMKVSKFGSYKLYHREEYHAPVTPPLLYINGKPSKYGIRIMVQQTKGPPRTYPYLFI